MIDGVPHLLGAEHGDAHSGARPLHVGLAVVRALPIARWAVEVSRKSDFGSVAPRGDLRESG